MLWTSFQKIGTMLISFGVNIYLARLLSPSDFGCIGILLVFVNLSTVLVDAGFGSALIQKHNVSKLDYSTIFYWNLLLSIVLYSLLCLFSDKIARFYQIDILSRVLRVLGLVLMFNSLSMIQVTKLKSEMNFKLLAKCFMLATIFSAIITLIMAEKGCGIWSLVAFQLVQSIVNTILLWLYAKWAPALVFSWLSFKRLFNYGVFLLLSSIFNTLCNQIQALFIGKVCNTTTLGYYSQAKNLENAPTNVIYSVVGQVIFPIFSANKDDCNRLSEIFKRITSSVAYFTIPLMLLLILLARPIIVILLSDKWLPSVPFFQILCVAGIATTLVDISYYTIASTGASNKIFKWTLCKNVIGVCLILLGAFGGIYGILVGVVLYAYLGYGMYSILLKRVIGLGYYKQFRDLIPIVIVAFIAFLVSYYLYQVFDIHYIFQGCIFVITYLSLTIICQLKSTQWVKESILDLFNRLK